MHILACFVTSGAFNSHVGKIGVEWLVPLPYNYHLILSTNL